MRKILIETLIELAEKDPNLWLLTADLGFSFMEKFAERFPNRFLNVGVAEQNMIGIASGLALMGKKVFVYSIINFLTFRCLEQIRNDICYHGLNITLVGVGTGYSYESSGYTHYGIEDIGLMKMLPNLQIYSPFDRYEMKEVVKSAMILEKPSYIRISKNACIEVDRKEKKEISKIQKIKEGKDLALLSYGSTVETCLKTAFLLEKEGFFPAVYSMPTLFSEIESLEKYEVLFVIEEQVSGELSEKIKKGISIPVFSYFIQEPLQYCCGTEKYLQERQGLDSLTLAKKIQQEFKQRLVCS